MGLLDIFKKILKNNKYRVIKEVKKEKFPCKDCIVLPTGSCAQLCEKVEMNDDEVMKLFLKHERCIDCGSDRLLEGPRGGSAQNIECAICHHKFNMGLPLFIQRI
jgi:LSD1 subclass zinc finger protein